MKKIKNLTVTVTYTVGLRDIEVDEQDFDALLALSERGCMDCSLVDSDKQVATAFEWLSDNIKERHAFDWCYEIDDFEE